MTAKHPRYEDGTPILIGDTVTYHDETAVVTAIEADDIALTVDYLTVGEILALPSQLERANKEGGE